VPISNIVNAILGDTTSAQVFNLGSLCIGDRPLNNDTIFGVLASLPSCSEIIHRPHSILIAVSNRYESFSQALWIRFQARITDP
jgi:hypothetical protein